MKIGSYEHKKLFCQSLINDPLSNHPASHSWPPLDPPAAARIQSVPFWGEVLRTQHNTAQVMSAFAQTLKDPMVKEAVLRQAAEQQHLTERMQSFVHTYNIASSYTVPAELPSLGIPKPQHLEAAFVAVGYRKCLDLFWADGLRAAAHQANFIPEDLNQQFEVLLAEQSRHTVFLVNWMAYQNIKLNKRWGELRVVSALWQRSGALVKLIAAFGPKDEDERSEATRWMVPLSAEAFLNICLTEHERRMQSIRTELLQPQFSVNLAKLIREAFKVWPQRKAAPTIDMLKP